MSVVIGILLQSTAWYTWVKQYLPQLILGMDDRISMSISGDSLSFPGAALAATV